MNKKNIQIKSLISLLLFFVFSPINAQDSSESFENSFKIDNLNKVEIFFQIDEWREAVDASNELVEAEMKINKSKKFSVKIARKGNTSNNNTRARDKIPFKVDGPGGFNFKLNNNYRDYTMGAREYIGYRLHKEFTGIGPSTAPTEVFINGKFYGLYLAVEDLNKQFYNAQIGGITQRVKASPTDRGAFDGGAHSNLFWLGNNVNRYSESYEIKTGDFEELLELIDIINNKAEIASNFIDIEQVCKFLAVENYLLNTDGIIGLVYSHNYELVKRKSDEKWMIIPWDLNLCLGGFTEVVNTKDEQIIDGLSSLPLNSGRDKNALIRLILKNYFYLYHYQYINLINNYDANLLSSWATDYYQWIDKSKKTDDKLYEANFHKRAYQEDLTTIDGMATALIPTIQKRYTFIKDLGLEDKFTNVIEEIQLDENYVLIKVSEGLEDIPLIVKYTAHDNSVNKIRAHKIENNEFQYSALLPEGTKSFYAYAIHRGIKFPFPYNGELNPMPLD